MGIVLYFERMYIRIPFLLQDTKTLILVQSEIDEKSWFLWKRVHVNFQRVITQVRILFNDAYYSMIVCAPITIPPLFWYLICIPLGLSIRAIS